MKWSLLTATTPHSGISPSFKVSGVLQKIIHFPSNFSSSEFCSKGSWLSPLPRGLWSPRFPLTPAVQFWRSGTSVLRSWFLKNLFDCAAHAKYCLSCYFFPCKACFNCQILNDEQLVVDLPEIRCTAPSEQLCGETWSFFLTYLLKSGCVLGWISNRSRWLQ